MRTCSSVVSRILLMTMGIASVYVNMLLTLSSMLK